MFFINQILIDKSKCNYFKTIVLLNKKNAIENQFRNDMKKHGYDWNTILAHFIGKIQEILWQSQSQIVLRNLSITEQ